MKARSPAHLILLRVLCPFEFTWHEPADEENPTQHLCFVFLFFFFSFLKKQETKQNNVIRNPLSLSLFFLSLMIRKKLNQQRKTVVFFFLAEAGVDTPVTSILIAALLSIARVCNITYVCCLYNVLQQCFKRRQGFSLFGLSDVRCTWTRDQVIGVSPLGF